MKNILHEPGPWSFRVLGDANEYALVSNDKRWVITIRHNGEMMLEKQMVNIRLITAAPDLLAALEKLANEHQELLTLHYGRYPMGCIDYAFQAIHKAKSGS